MLAKTLENMNKLEYFKMWHNKEFSSSVDNLR